MEKETVTIEIKQEVSVTLLWIVAGVVLVSGALLLMPQSTELWPAVGAAGVAATVFIVALLVYTLRNPIGAKSRLLAALIACLALGGSGASWLHMFNETHWQAEQLMNIRAVIGRGIGLMEMTQPLLKVLDAYHRQGKVKKHTLADEFRILYNGAGVGSNIHVKQGDWDTRTVIVESLEPNRIVLISQETFVPGRDSMFKNYDGKSGMLQEKYILTEKGIEHVSEN